jgi:hypothetical protein
MSTPTKQQIINALDRAIHDIATGQVESKSIDLGGGKIMNATMLNLDQLRAMRREYNAEKFSDSNGTFINPSFAPKGEFYGS